MKLEEIKEIVAFFEKSGLSKFVIKKGDVELLLEKELESKVMLPSQKTESPKIEEPVEKDNLAFVTSPMVGTFYAAPAPGQKTFVKKGDVVTKDTIVCIVEAMKVLNEVKAGVDGMIKGILCKNAQPVEFGTKLFSVEAS